MAIFGVLLLEHGDFRNFHVGPRRQLNNLSSLASIKSNDLFVTLFDQDNTVKEVNFVGSSLLPFLWALNFTKMENFSITVNVMQPEKPVMSKKG